MMQFYELMHRPKNKAMVKSLLTVRWEEGKVVMIDQTRLPTRLVYVEYDKYEDVARAIKSLVVRGAPAIGVAAAFGMCLAAFQSKARDHQDLLLDLQTAYETLKSTRPTAMNLAWALDLIMGKAKEGISVKEIRKNILDTSIKMADEDISTNKKIGQIGAKMISNDETVLTHCNAGSLATVGYGTALGVIRAAKESGKEIRVIATETRPVMQGSRLTAFELKHDGISVSLIPDTASGYVLSQGMVNRVIVGADRVLRSGHVFNKIGTYQIAALARRHEIPFYVAAPTSTFDLKSELKDIVIEERDRTEVIRIGNRLVAPLQVRVFNPAFDITPPDLITGIITEKGVLFAPFEEGIREIISSD
jgi:methylthioribose-1-phosphate isomerase